MLSQYVTNYHCFNEGRKNLFNATFEKCCSIAWHTSSVISERRKALTSFLKALHTKGRFPEVQETAKRLSPLYSLLFLFDREGLRMKLNPTAEKAKELIKKIEIGSKEITEVESEVREVLEEIEKRKITQIFNEYALEIVTLMSRYILSSNLRLYFPLLLHLEKEGIYTAHERLAFFDIFSEEMAKIKYKHLQQTIKNLQTFPSGQPLLTLLAPYYTTFIIFSPQGGGPLPGGVYYLDYPPSLAIELSRFFEPVTWLFLLQKFFSEEESIEILKEISKIKDPTTIPLLGFLENKEGVFVGLLFLQRREYTIIFQK